MKKILLINGANLNRMHKRAPSFGEGETTLDEIVEYVRAYAEKCGFQLDHFQSNHEGKIVDKLQEADGVYDGIIINPGPFTQYSHAIRVTLASLPIPSVEVHLVNIHKTGEPTVPGRNATGVIAATMRNIARLNHELRTVPGLPWGPIANLGHSMRNKTLGIIGMGRIGRGVAKRALAFGMNIIYNNRKSVGEELEGFLGGARLVSLEELLRTSDAVFINAPLTPETFHMISDKELEMMKPDAYIFNQGRGKIIDEEALIRCLKSGKLAGAGLDVFETEPNINPELLKFPNVVVTAHMGTSTYEDKAGMVAAAGENIIEYFEHKRFPHIVNPQVLPKLGL